MQFPHLRHERSRVKFKKGDTVIYPQHGACIVVGTKKMEAFGGTQEYLILRTVINDMTLSVPTLKAGEVGVRPPVNPEELEDLVSVLSKPDPRVPSNWSRRFKNHQEKLKSGDVYQVAEVVRNLAARNRDASLSAAERTMYDRARINLISEIAPALKVKAEEAEHFLDEALAKGVLKPARAAKSVTKPVIKVAAKTPEKVPAAKTQAAKTPAKTQAAKTQAAKAPAAKSPAKTPAKSAAKAATKSVAKKPAKAAPKAATKTEKKAAKKDAKAAKAAKRK